MQGFDPDLRKELGIWYTPPEIVQYEVVGAMFRLALPGVVRPTPK